MSGCDHGPEFLRVGGNGARRCAVCAGERKRRARRREREQGCRRALVYAREGALRDARALLGPTQVLENIVTRRIAEGHIRRRKEHPGCALVDLGAGLCAFVARVRRPSGRKSWLVLSVRGRE
jgi:hypothetical protein